MIFMEILSIASIIWMLVSITGFVLYKLWSLESWQAGIKSFLTFGLNTMYEEMTGRAVPSRMVDDLLMLTNEEALNLVREFEGHPYDAVCLESCSPNINGILWLDIRSFGLVRKYEDLVYEDIQRISYSIIQNYYMRIRNRQVNLFIRVATPTRLYVAIPLSEEGRKYLEKEIPLNHAENQEPQSLQMDVEVHKDHAEVLDDDSGLL